MDIKALAYGEKRIYYGIAPPFPCPSRTGSRHEVETTKRITEELEKMGIEVMTFSDITGCIGVIRGGHDGGTVALRADIDALPIQEADLTKEYASQNAGVMHACGHDCHTAMLLGAAKILSAHREEIHGTVKLLFQMAEEIGTESRHYVENGSLSDVDAIFGMHIWATLDAGKVNFEDGERMACSDRFTVKIKGKAAHGSEPDKGADAVVAAAAVVMGLQTLVSRRTDPQNTFVLTVGMMNGGTQSNIIAEEVELVGTTRTFNKKFRKGLPDMIKAAAEGIAEGYGCEAESTYFFYLAPLVNEHISLNRISAESSGSCHGRKGTGSHGKGNGGGRFRRLYGNHSRRVRIPRREKYGKGNLLRSSSPGL